MRAASREEIEDFADLVKEVLGDRLEKVMLYGSHARGEALPGSDVDIAVFVSEKQKGDREKLQELRKDFLLEDEIYFSPRVFEIDRLKNRASENSFFGRIQEEGIEI